MEDLKVGDHTLAIVDEKDLKGWLENLMRIFRFLANVNWVSVIWIGLIHAGALVAPFAFSWSAVVICLSLYWLTIVGVSMGYHRLLTHRSFQTPRFVEYLLTVFGTLASQGGALSWVATHRAHHAHPDADGDPHSPRDGTWWAHMRWWMTYDPMVDDSIQRQRYVRDLTKDPIHRFLNRCQLPLQLGLAALLYVLGEAWGGAGLAWVIWGVCVRTMLGYHATWLVNSATHQWGSRQFRTRDDSTNLWWVALLTCGEGWHNNHHAFPSSARHGLRWWQFDVTYILIRLLESVGLAWRVQVPSGHELDRSGPLTRDLAPGLIHTLGNVINPGNFMRRTVGICCGIALLAGMPCLLLLALISALTGSR
jgi:Fatty-acid desaturase